MHAPRRTTRRALMWLGPALGAAASCCTPSHRTRAPEADPAVDHAGLEGDDRALGVELTVLALLPETPQFAVLTQDARIPTGSHLRLSVVLTRPAYVYIYQVASATQSVRVLFPHAYIDEDNPRPGSTALEIPPPPATFRLNAQDLGVEEINVVASITPIPALEASLSRLDQEPGSITESELDCAASEVEPSEGRDCSEIRGMIRVPRDMKHSLGAINAASDDAVHFVYRFDHVAH